jgi:hypothetical protein
MIDASYVDHPFHTLREPCGMSQMSYRGWYHSPHCAVPLGAQPDGRR